MANDAELLRTVARGLNGLGGSISALVAENSRLSARNAELEGEDAEESAAAQNVVSEFNSLANQLTQEPEAPNVDPVETPSTEGNSNSEPQPAPVAEPVQGESNAPDAGTPVENEVADDPNSPLT